MIEELWEYFVDTYFSPEIPNLENISFGTGTLVTLKTIIIGLVLLAIDLLYAVVDPRIKARYAKGGKKRK